MDPKIISKSPKEESSDISSTDVDIDEDDVNEEPTEKLEKLKGLKEVNEEDVKELKENDDIVNEDVNEEPKEELKEIKDVNEETDESEVDEKEEIKEDTKEETKEIEDEEEGTMTEENCPHEMAKKKKIIKETDIDDIPIDDVDIFEVEEKKVSTFVTKEDRITKNILGNYERVRLLEERTTQLINGAKPLVKNIEGLDEKQIANLELKYKTMPLFLIRQRPDGLKEKWAINEFVNI